MAHSWQKIDKFKAYAQMEVFLNQQGKDYVRRHAFTPEIIVRDFKQWRYVMGRKLNYVRDQTLVTFTAQTCKHRIVTKPRLYKFMAKHSLTTNKVAHILGYAHNRSMLGNPFSWRRIELWMDNFESTQEAIEAIVTERLTA